MHPDQIPNVTVADVTPETVLLDVREPEEWAAGHIAGAMHVPMNEVPNRLAYEPDSLTADTQVVVLCKAGGRSAAVTGWLRGQGYDAVNLEGGMLAWAAAGRPMEADGDTAPQVI